MASANDQKYQLFITRKTMQQVEQPGYGTDMRTIENWAAFLISGIHGSNATLEAQITALQALVAAQTPQIDSYSVGSPPPAGTPIITQKFTTTVTFAAGVGSVGLSGFAHGYDALVGNEGAGAGSTIISGWDAGASSLSSLGVTAISAAGVPLVGPQTISVLLMGT